MPGPLFSITVAESARRGPMAGPLIIMGHGILELSLVVFIILGIAPLLHAPSTITAIGIVGGLALMYMGYKLIKDARAAHFSTAGEKAHEGIHPILSGIIGSVSNPYWIMWWVTVGMGYLVGSIKFGLAGVAAFFTGHIAADLGWYSLVSLAVAKGKRLIGDKGYRTLLYSCGFFLVFLGIWFLKRAVGG